MRIRLILIALLLAEGAFGQANDRLIRQVRRELVTLPFLSVYDNLAFKIEGDKVTLMGQTTRPVLKSDAENVVKSLEAVAAVENQIEVLPVSPNDDRLRARLFQAIYGFASLRRYDLPVVKPIRIIVKNGNLTLEGFVDNEGDKTVVGLRANGVHGVFSVTNNLQVNKSN